MRSRTLQTYLEHPDLKRQLAGHDEVVIGIGRDPDDLRRSCIVLYVPQGFDRAVPPVVTLGDEAVKVVTRERGGVLRAY